MENDTRGVHISAGDGIVAHVSHLTAYASGEEAALNELLVRLNALAGEPWQEIVRELTSGIADAGYTDHPALACVSVDDDKVAALVFGDTALSVTIDGAETILDGRDSSTWIDVALRGSLDRVHAGLQSDSAVVGVLRDGVVPAGGFLLDTSGPIPASGRWSEATNSTTEEAAAEQAPAPAEEAAVEQAPAPVQEAAVEQAPAPAEEPVAEQTTTSHLVDAAIHPQPSRSMFARIEEIVRATQELRDADSDVLEAANVFNEDDSQPLDASPVSEKSAPAEGAPSANPASEPAPAQAATLAPQRPQLKGVLCTAGHLTAPLETTCRSCEEPVEIGAALATGDRPVLGTLTFDDGAVLNIDRPAAVGAEVPGGYVIDNEPATIVRLDDGVGGVSALQLEVRLSGWNVEIVDMDSENGTYTMLRGERQTRTKLRANQAVTLQRDMEVQTGGRSFVFAPGPSKPPAV